MSTQSEASKFYSTYSVPDTVEKGAYKGIDCGYGGAGFEMEDELRDGGIEKEKSDSYSCKVEISGDSRFDLQDFLNWLIKETKKQIEQGEGLVVAQRSAAGEGFRLEYKGKDYKGSVDVKAKYISKDWLGLEVKLKEGSGR